MIYISYDNCKPENTFAIRYVFVFAQFKDQESVCEFAFEITVYSSFILKDESILRKHGRLTVYKKGGNSTFLNNIFEYNHWELRKTIVICTQNDTQRDPLQ